MVTVSPSTTTILTAFGLLLLVAFFTPSLAELPLVVVVEFSAPGSESGSCLRLGLRVTVFTTTASPAALATIRISGAALGLALARRELMERKN